MHLEGKSLSQGFDLVGWPYGSKAIMCVHCILAINSFLMDDIMKSPHYSTPTVCFQNVFLGTECIPVSIMLYIIFSGHYEEFDIH